MSAEVFRYPLVELYAAGDWHDITEDVRYQGGIAIDRGRGGEDDTAPPQTCRVTLDDRNGDYNPRNPNGAYFGSIGRNTPLRVNLMIASTGFGTTASNGWGSTDDVDGQAVYAWSTAGGAASNFAVAAGKATHALAAAGDLRVSYLSAVDLANVEARVTVTVPTSNVTGTGGIAAANILLHGQGGPSDWYQLLLLIKPDESVTLDVVDQTGASFSLFGETTVPGLTHTSGQALRVAFGIEGRTLRAKVWPASGVEPYGWHLVVVDEDLDDERPTVAGQAGWVGILSGLVTGNTNGPITLSYDDFELRHPRFSGEISTWPATRNITSTDITVTVTASGPKRRGSQGAAPLDSPYRRALSAGFFGVRPVAYWPLEDKFRQVAGEVLAVIGSGRLAFTPPTAGTTAGKITWASDSTLPGSDALPALTGGGSLVGELTPRASDAGWYLTWSQRISVEDGSFNLFATVDDHMQITPILDPGTPTVLTYYLTAPGVSAPIMSHTFASKEDAEAWHTYQLDVEQSGPDVAFFLWVDGELADSHTQSSMLMRGLYRVQFSSPTSATRQTSFGHVAVWETFPVASLVHEAALGNPSETAGQRMQRLCGEESTEFDWIGALEIGTYPPVSGTTPLVGPQELASLLANMEAAAAVDQGLLFEQRSRIAYHYRTLASLYDQTPVVTLDYAAGEIAPDWRPVDDDRYTRNDVTTQRTDGGTYRHQVTTGRLSTAAVEDGGAGVYRESITVNVQTDAQLPGIAEWRAHLGTVDETRYPAVNVQLHGHGLRGSAAKQFALLDLDVGDRVVIENATELGVLADIDQLAIGYHETITPYEHAISLVCAPASPYQVLVLDDTVFGRLDSGSSSLTAGISDSATSWQVTTTDPLDLWTTTPAEFPLDVMVGGERITLSSITGASSPQTFNASARSVNGITKSHAAGAEVHVADVVYLGL